MTTSTATIEKTKERLIKPFQSKIMRNPAMPGFRVTKGKWSKRLDDMGYKDFAEGKENDERYEAFLNHLKWDIAHRNYKELKPCISIEKEYDEQTQQLDYTIDLYGDGSVVKEGKLHVVRGDYLMSYMRMTAHRRKESLLSRIALANVGMLVPYVKLDELSYDDSRTEVKATYRIVL